MECYAEALVLLLKRANAMFSVLVLFKLNVTSLPMSASGMNPHATPKIDRNLIISAFLIVLGPGPNCICICTLGFRAMIFMHTWLPLFHIQYSQQAVTPPSEYSRLRLSPEKKNK